MIRTVRCGDELCLLDLRGDVYAVSGAGPRLAFTLPMDSRGVDLACFAAPPASCIVLDDSGELYPAPVDPGAMPPDVTVLPGAWPLPAQPRRVQLDPAASANAPRGVVSDAGGHVYRFGPALFPAAYVLGVDAPSL